MHEAGAKDEQILIVHWVEGHLKLERIVAKLMIVTDMRQKKGVGLTGSCELQARWL
jgi:hypothetical protein